MDWTNERYVRVYTRDTAAMLTVAWDELALFWGLLRKVDRSGVLDLEGLGAGALVAHLRCPADVAERALAAWTAAGWVEVSGDMLVIPSHLEAQEALTSDAQRQRRSRELRRARVTGRDEMSHAVTDGHTESHAVTPSLAVPSLILCRPSKLDLVWGFYLQTREKAGLRGSPPVLNEDRKKKIAKRLKTYAPERAKVAIRNLFDPALHWMAGGYTLPELVFRSDAQFEKLENGATRAESVDKCQQQTQTTAWTPEIGAAWRRKHGLS